MDELVIGDKKYISSKQAAKATGYAKDYIGQLCREGRVPARLVGRSWYVLESAIHDHRFGEPKEKLSTSAVEGKDISATSIAGWEPPRYTATKAETLPAINLLKKPTTPAADGEEDSKRLQDSWQAWFDRFDAVASVSSGPMAENENSNLGREEAGEVASVQHEEVAIPVHAIHHQPHQQKAAESVKEMVRVQHMNRTEFKEEERADKEETSWMKGVFQFVGVTVALFMLISAVFNSGYLDRYISSYNTASIMTGIYTYEK